MKCREHIKSKFAAADDGNNSNSYLVLDNKFDILTSKMSITYSYLKAEGVENTC